MTLRTTSQWVFWRNQTLDFVPTVFFLAAAGRLLLTTDDTHYKSAVTHVFAVVGALVLIAVATWGLEQWVRRVRTDGDSARNEK
jgi:hypothetical protein